MKVDDDLHDGDAPTPADRFDGYLLKKSESSRPLAEMSRTSSFPRTMSPWLLLLGLRSAGLILDLSLGLVNVAFTNPPYIEECM